LIRSRIALRRETPCLREDRCAIVLVNHFICWRSFQVFDQALSIVLAVFARGTYTILRFLDVKEVEGQPKLAGLRADTLRVLGDAALQVAESENGLDEFIPPGPLAALQCRLARSSGQGREPLLNGIAQQLLFPCNDDKITGGRCVLLHPGHGLLVSRAQAVGGHLEAQVISVDDEIE